MQLILTKAFNGISSEHTVHLSDMPPVYVHDFGVSHARKVKPDVTKVKGGFEEAFVRAWYGEIENDDFNRLVLRANLGWREITTEIENALDSVENLDEDRILRRFLALIRATVRTNISRKTPAGHPNPTFPASSTQHSCLDCLSPNQSSKSTFTRRASRGCI